ncbi:MAG: helix-turn-helix transcriptional regulator [Acidobacteria bacterium]|nr:helix-turn-helix transcriptional regulator [Acidobacteriota bacterium]
MHPQISSYNPAIMAGRPPTKDAPPFGRRLSAVRKSRGWSQKELAAKLETTREVIDYYERRAVNPSLAFIERAAQALEVSVAELLGSEPAPVRGRPGRSPQLARRLEQIRLLPRKEQEFVIRFLDTVLEKAGRG